MSWPGLSRPSRLGGLAASSGYSFVEIAPARVLLRDEASLPGARPVLHVLFALESIADVTVLLVVYELVDIISLGEAGYRAALVSVHAANEVVGDADVNGSPGRLARI